MRAALVLLGLFLPAAATAHGEYAWINNNNYKNAKGIHCCGPKDCPRISERDYKRLPDGSYVVTVGGGTQRIPAKAVYKSKDWFPRFCHPGCLFTAPRAF